MSSELATTDENVDTSNQQKEEPKKFKTFATLKTEAGIVPLSKSHAQTASSIVYDLVRCGETVTNLVHAVVSFSTLSADLSDIFNYSAVKTYNRKIGNQPVHGSKIMYRGKKSTNPETATFSHPVFRAGSYDAPLHILKPISGYVTDQDEQKAIEKGDSVFTDDMLTGKLGKNGIKYDVTISPTTVVTEHPELFEFARILDQLAMEAYLTNASEHKLKEDDMHKFLRPTITFGEGPENQSHNYNPWAPLISDSSQIGYINFKGNFYNADIPVENRKSKRSPVAETSVFKVTKDPETGKLTKTKGTFFDLLNRNVLGKTQTYDMCVYVDFVAAKAETRKDQNFGISLELTAIYIVPTVPRAVVEGSSLSNAEVSEEEMALRLERNVKLYGISVAGGFNHFMSIDKPGIESSKKRSRPEITGTDEPEPEPKKEKNLQPNEPATGGTQ